MSTTHINENQKYHIYDELHNGNGKLLAKGESHSSIIGEVEVIHSSKRNGKRIFTRSFGWNDLLLTGAVFMSEKINNRRSTFLTTPIDVSLGVHAIEDLDRSAAMVPQERIFGIMIGNGGCGEAYNSIHRVTKTDLAVPGMIPFRVVPLDRDLTGATRDKYCLRVVKDGRAWYYGKVFEAEPEINILYEDGRLVPVSIATSANPTTGYIKTFTKYTAIVDAEDVRQYMILTEGSTMRSRVNSVGLMTGYAGVCTDDNGTTHTEMFNVRGATTLNMENQDLKDMEATISFVYRLYIA